MERVEPIISVKKINDLKKYLIGSGNMRNYALIVLGLNSALRISDMLSLTWEDVFHFEENQFKTHVYIKEKKTGKVKKFRDFAHRTKYRIRIKIPSKPVSLEG